LSSRESWLQIRGNPQHEFARKLAPEPQFPANPFAAIPAISIAGQPLRDISRTTNADEHQQHVSAYISRDTDELRDVS
jgi:hypothetical protein